MHDIYIMLEQVFIKPARAHSKNDIHDVSSPIRRISMPLKIEKKNAARVSITNLCIAEEEAHLPRQNNNNMTKHIEHFLTTASII